MRPSHASGFGNLSNAASPQTSARWQRFATLTLICLIVLFGSGQPVSPASAAPSQQPPPAATSPDATTSVPGTRTWQSEPVDGPRRFREINESALKFDHAGQPHVAYGSGALYYASPAGEAWRIETIDAQHDAGYYPSLAFDAHDVPHISYTDRGTLKHAYLQAGRWISETVDASGTFTGTTSIAIDRAGRPQMSYFDSATGTLRHARWTGTKWELTTVGASYGFSSLALTSTDQPIIAFGNPTGLKLAMWWPACGWTIESVESGAGAARPSLRLDGRDLPYIAYADPVLGSGQTLAKKASWDADWQRIRFSDDPASPSDVALAVTPSGDVTIASFTIANRELYLEYITADSMGVRAVDQSNFQGYNPSIALDPAGNPAIVYFADISPMNKYLTYAHWEDPIWRIQRVDEERQRAVFDDMKLDRTGRPHVAYCQQGGASMVWYVSQGAHGWERIGLDTGKPSCGAVSLAFDAENRPHLAIANDQGTYAWWDGSRWQSYNIDNQSLFMVSLVIGRDDRARLGYLTPSGLWYATWRGSCWAREPIETHPSLRSLRLALDANDIPRMVYLRNPGISSPDELVYTRRMNGSWQLSTLRASGPDWADLSLAVGAGGVEHMAYFQGNGGLSYARSNGNDAWTFEAVTPTNIGGVSLALDSAQQPHIAFETIEYPTNCAQIRYAYLRGGEWAIQTVVIVPSAISGPLALDAANNAFLLYNTWDARSRAWLWLARSTDDFVPQPPPPPPPPPCQNSGGGAGANSGCTLQSGARLYLPLLGAN